MNSRPPLLTALLHPLNLSMLALIAAAGLCSAWWLAPVGLLFWLVMVIVIARDPGVQITFTRQSREPLAQSFQTRFDRLDRARISIFNSLQRADPSFRKAVEPLQIALDDLVEHAYKLGLHMTAIENNYSVQRLSNNFDDDIEKMKQNIKDEADASSRREYEETLKSLQTRRGQLKTMSTLISRFEAQLTGTNNAVDGVVSSLVGLQGRNSKQADEKFSALLKIIQTEETELKQFGHTLEKASLI